MLKKFFPSLNLYYLLTILLVSISYTCLRFTLNIEYGGATWKMLYELVAPVPFGNRILVPLLSRPLVAVDFDIKIAFMFWEVAFSILLIYSLFRVFRLYLDDKWSRLFSLLIFLFLPLAFLLKFKWPIFYPYDTAAMAFIILSMYLVLKERWMLLVILVAIATLNRESSILVPLIFAAMYADKMATKRFFHILILLSSAYIAVRIGLMEITRSNPHPYGGQMAFVAGDHLRINTNLYWFIRNPVNPFIFLGSIGFTPLFVVLLRKSIPQHIMNLALVCGVYIFMLAFIGNLYESRIFGEVLVIAYVMICLGTYSYLNETVLPAPNSSLRSESFGQLLPIVVYFNKYGWNTLVFAGVIGVVLLNLLGVDYFNR